MLQHRLVAHRGYQKLYPENTLLAMRKAIEAGARYIETDIQFSADGVPVLYHDMAMKRLSGVENLIGNLRIGRINALFTQVQQLWTAVDSFDTPAMQPNPADGEPATLKIYPPLSH